MPFFSAWVERASNKNQTNIPFHLDCFLFIQYIREYVANMLFDRSGYVFGTDTWNEFSMFYYFAGFNGYLLFGHYLKEGGNGNALKIF